MGGAEDEEGRDEEELKNEVAELEPLVSELKEEATLGHGGGGAWGVGHGCRACSGVRVRLAGQSCCSRAVGPASEWWCRWEEES